MSLRANRPFRLLWTARTVSVLGDSVSLVALMLYVAFTTGQAVAVALLLLAGEFAPALNTLLQRSVPRAFLGRVFGSLYGAIGVGAALSYVLGGLLLDATSPRVTFIVAGTGGLIATLVTAASLRR